MHASPESETRHQQPKTASGPSLLRWLRHDPLTIGGIAVVVTSGNTLLLGLPLSTALLVAAGAGAALVYWADRVLGFSPEDEHAHPDRVDWVQQRRRWLFVEGFALGGTLAAALPYLTLETLGVAALCGGLGVVHVFPVLPGRHRLKATGRGRTLTIALAWSVGSVILPWVEAGGLAANLLGAGGAPIAIFVVGGLLLAQTLVVYGNVVVAGWVDRHGDKHAGIPVNTHRSGMDVRRRAVAAAAGGGGIVLALGATAVPMPLAISYAAAAFGVAVLLRHLRPQRVPRHMLWLDLAVALPGAVVILVH